MILSLYNMGKCSICNISGHNKRTCSQLNKMNINYIINNVNNTKKNTRKALNNEKIFINDFNSDLLYYNNIVNILKINNFYNDLNNNKFIAVKPVKKNNYECVHTDLWKKYKNGSKEKYPVPKTDVILKYDNTKIKLSLKSGEGRPTSCDLYETKSLFYSILYSNDIYANDDYLKNNVNNMIKLMEDTGKKKSVMNYNITSIEKENSNNNLDFLECKKWVTKLRNNSNIANKIWKELYINRNDYIIDVLIECFRGYYKFGYNIGSADYLILFESSNNIKVKKCINLQFKNEELINYCQKKANINVFAGKSSRSNKKSPYKMWMRFL